MLRYYIAASSYCMCKCTTIFCVSEFDISVLFCSLILSLFMRWMLMVTSQWRNVQVLGCHAQSTYHGPRLTQDFNIIQFSFEVTLPGKTMRDSAVDLNGTKCMCVARSDLTEIEKKCIATCASGVDNYHIQSTNGSGTVKAECPKRTTVLGCAAYSKNAQSDRRSAVVEAGTSCRCHDDYFVVCIAMCGTLIPEGASARASVSLPKTAVLCDIIFVLILLNRMICKV